MNCKKDPEVMKRLLEPVAKRGCYGPE